MKVITKEFLTYIILTLIAIILIILGCVFENVAAEISLNIGLSILSTVIVYFILKFLAEDPMDSVVNKIDNLSEELTESIDMLRSTKETGIINSWNTRSDVPVNKWISRINEADGDISVLCYAMSFLVDDSNFDDAIISAVNSGYNVRLLFGKPNGMCVSARTIEEKNEGNIAERIERAVLRIKSINKMLPNDKKIVMKYHDTPLYASMYFFGTKALITPQLYSTRGALAPIIEITKTDVKQCMYNKYLEMFEKVWAQGEAINEL